MKRYVLDSYAMIAFFEDEPGAHTIASLLRELLDNRAKGYMSVVNWGEMYYSVMREQGSMAAETILSQFKKYPIEVVDADQVLTHEAAKLKGSYRIAYADCFAAALSMKLNATLVTGDPEFRQLGKKISIQWIDLDAL
ncbi:MAG: type II toxin-antitoxin system VapC family toxin [Deltaproteobacteria bacterium]|nr:type II toxin-antitoxin system VapC family toxin [Deltaproteobacteria bacterium]